MNIYRVLIAATVLTSLNTIDVAQAEDVRFVTCPVYRDTRMGRRAGCWLADDPATGQRYDVSESWSLPDWSYGVLVEGNIAKDVPDDCGGIRLDPVRTSVLTDMECPRKVFPAEGYPGRMPKSSDRYVMPLSYERKLPPPPYETTTFSPTFDFDSSFVIFNHSDYAIDQAVAYIKASNAKRVILTGWAATEPVDLSGRTLAETEDMARERIDVVEANLLGMGIDADIIEKRVGPGSTTSDTEFADGLEESSRRRVDITVIVE